MFKGEFIKMKQSSSCFYSPSASSSSSSELTLLESFLCNCILSPFFPERASRMESHMQEVSWEMVLRPPPMRGWAKWDETGEAGFCVVTEQVSFVPIGRSGPGPSETVQKWCKSAVTMTGPREWLSWELSNTGTSAGGRDASGQTRGSPKWGTEGDIQYPKYSGNDSIITVRGQRLRELAYSRSRSRMWCSRNPTSSDQSLSSSFSLSSKDLTLQIKSTWNHHITLNEALWFSSTSMTIPWVIYHISYNCIIWNYFLSYVLGI